MPNGAVVEYDYDAEGRLLSQCAYATFIDPQKVTDASTPDEVQSLLNKSEDDRVCLYRYDNDGKRLYTINAQGAVKETHRDAAGRAIGETAYAQVIALSTIKTTDPAEIKTLLHPDPENDRSHYHLLDLAGQEVFAIDALGAVIEYRYDANGNHTQTTHYATPIAISQLLELTPDAVQAVLQPSADDRITYQVFDDIDRLIFTIDPEGAVTQNDYDVAGQVKTETAYATLLKDIPTPVTVASIAAAISADHDHDRITAHHYDVMRNRTATVNALGETESWRYNAFSECISHTDRRGYTFESGFDHAGRKISEKTPETLMGTVDYDPQNKNALHYQGEHTVRLITQTTHDKNGNPLSIARGYEEKSEVTFVSALHSIYDAGNHVIETQMPNVLIDDPTKEIKNPGDRPDALATAVTNRVFNSFGQPLVEMDESTHAHFTVYDVAGRVRYRVQANGFVTRFDRNAFGDTITVVQFATPLALDLSHYLTSGLTPTLVEAHLTPSASDRQVRSDFDKNGALHRIIEPSVFAFEQTDAQTIVTERVFPRTRMDRNAFGEIITRTTLQNPKSKVGVVEHYWFDRCGRVRAKADADGYVTCLRYNADGKEIEQIEYAQALSPADLNTDYETLLSRLHPSPEDRTRQKEYDPLSRRILEREVAVPVESVSLDGHGIPQLHSQTQDLVTQYTYDAGDHELTVTYPNGGQTVNEYDALGRLTKKRGLARADSHDPTTLYYEERLSRFDALSHAVYEERSVEVKAPKEAVVSLEAIPDPQITFRLYDPRGLCLMTQASTGATTSKSYTGTRQVARTFQWVSGWDLSKLPKPSHQADLEQKEADTLTHRLYEVRTHYDSNDRPIREDRREVMSGQTLTWQKTYNLFGEIIEEGEGTGENPWPIQRRFDAAGRLWWTNEDQGIATVRLYDGRGQQTGQLRSATEDLSEIKEGDLEQWVHEDPMRVQRLG